MPKATLEFNLPEEASEHLLAIHGTEWALVAWDMDQHLRGRLKYQDLTEEVYDALQATRDELGEFIDNRNLSLGEIT